MSSFAVPLQDYTKYTNWKKFKEIRKKQAQNKKKINSGSPDVWKGFCPLSLFVGALLGSFVYILAFKITFSWQGLVNFVHTYYWHLIAGGIFIILWPLLVKPTLLTIRDSLRRRQ